MAASDAEFWKFRSFVRSFVRSLSDGRRIVDTERRRRRRDSGIGSCFGVAEYVEVEGIGGVWYCLLLVWFAWLELEFGVFVCVF